MRRIKGVVERGPMEKVPFDVYEHEVPILMAIHGEAAVHVDASSAYEDDAEYDAVKEYDRLTQRYGDNSETGMAWVERLYGMQSAGQLQYFWEMHGGTKPDKPKTTKKGDDQAPDPGLGLDGNPDGTQPRTDANAVLGDLTGATDQKAADAQADQAAADKLAGKGK